MNIDDSLSLFAISHFPAPPPPLYNFCCCWIAAVIERLSSRCLRLAFTSSFASSSPHYCLLAATPLTHRRGVFASSSPHLCLSITSSPYLRCSSPSSSQHHPTRNTEGDRALPLRRTSRVIVLFIFVYCCNWAILVNPLAATHFSPPFFLL